MSLKEATLTVPVESEVGFTAAYLYGYMKALGRAIGISDTRTITLMLEELQRVVEKDKAYHAVKEG